MGSRARRVFVWATAAVLGLAVLAVPLSAPSAQDVPTARTDLGTSPDFRLRVSAALFLGKARADGTRADIERALSDPHPAVRIAAAAALGAFGDPAAIPALQRAMAKEASASAKSQMGAAIEALKKPAGVEWRKTRYVVQLGTMKNSTPVRGGELVQVLKSATKVRAQGLDGAIVADVDDVALMKEAWQHKVPVLAIDGNVTKLDKGQFNGQVTYSAQVEYTMRKLPDHALRGTLTGGATTIGSTRSQADQRIVAELQNQAVDGAVQSALKGADQNFPRAAK